MMKNGLTTRTKTIDIDSWRIIDSAWNRDICISKKYEAGKSFENGFRSENE